MEVFSIAVEYRRQELLDFVGSRQGQSGVIWGGRRTNALICTTGGRHGRNAGYVDEQLADGSWHYFGQGMKGSQTLSNSANARLADPDTTIFLFVCREPTSAEIHTNRSYGKLYRYVGQFIAAGHELISQKTGVRSTDALLRFHLMPIGLAQSWQLDQSSDLPSTTTELREWMLHEKSSPGQKMSVRRFWLRSLAITRFAQLRANGICEACGNQAPFLRADNSAYLEVHHLQRLSDAGPDIPENVAAICPNCHRRVHFGVDGAELNSRLIEKILQIERLQQSKA